MPHLTLVQCYKYVVIIKSTPLKPGLFLAQGTESPLDPRKKVSNNTLAHGQYTWLIRGVTFVYCCLWRESCNTYWLHDWREKHRLNCLRTRCPFHPATFCSHYHLPALSACPWSCLVLLLMSRPKSVFLLSHGIVSANTSCLFCGLVLILLSWENSFPYPYITPTKHW